MKMVLFAVTLGTTVGAFLTAAATVLGPGRFEGSTAWIVTKLIASGAIIAAGGMTFGTLLFGKRERHDSRTLSIAGVLTILVALASAASTSRAFWLSGDMEPHLFLLSVGLLLQGLMVIRLAGRPGEQEPATSI